MTAPAAPFPLTTRLHLAIYALVCTAFVGFAYTDGNLGAMIFLLAAILLAWFLVDSPPSTPRLLPTDARRQPFFDFKQHGAPKFFLNLIVLAAACFLWYEVASDYAHQSLIISLSHFILVLTMCKLLERKTPRDILQIVALSILIMVASAMYSSSGLLFTFILAIYFCAMLYVVMLVNLKAEIAHAAAGITTPSASLALLQRDLRVSVKQCFFLILPIAIVVFLIVPRTRSAPLASAWAMGSYQTGFTDNVQFRDYGQLSRSEVPVMTVWLTRGTSQGVPIRVTSEFTDLYFRGEVLTEYNRAQARWEHGNHVGNDVNNDKFEEDPPSERVLENFILEPRSDSNLFCIGPIIPPDSSNGWRYSLRNMTLSFITPGHPATRYPYCLAWSPNAHPFPENTTVPLGLLRPGSERRQAVFVSPEIMDLARRLASKLLGPNQTVAPDNARHAITIFENHLKTTYPYSLTFKQVDYSLDPTTDFLLNRKQSGGHCEYFASAMVMLCRSVGLNARLVVGYRGGDYNPVDNTLIVRQKDAHAWAEIYLADEGWFTSDPSPASAGNDSSSSFLGRWFGDIASVMHNLWLSVFVSFDNDSRHTVAAWFARHLGFLDQTFLSGFWGPLWLFVLLVAAWWAYPLWQKNRRRRRSTSFAAAFRSPHVPSQLAFLDALLRLFERPNHLRRPDQTPLEFLQPHLPELGPAATTARWLIHTAYGIRFGHLQLNAELRTQIALALRRVKSAKQNPGALLLAPTLKRIRA